jgi:hypothetical protein
MGGGQPLADSVQATLCDRLAQVPLAISFIAWQGDEAVGLVNCFEGFSTFKAQPCCSTCTTSSCALASAGAASGRRCWPLPRPTRGSRAAAS